MTYEPKKGYLKLEGTNPMALVELSEGPSEPWTQDQKETADAISASVKCYIKTTESLANGKYAHLRDKIPEYMANPGHLLVAICADGAVIRYEKKTLAERRLAVTVMTQGIADVAALLSQNLVHIESPEQPHPQNDNFGVEFKLLMHSPSQKMSQDIVATRIWFQAKPLPLQQDELPGAKPYCMLSVRNHLDIEIHGELVAVAGGATPNQPFVARSTIRLMAGWDCIEVFPGFKPEMWKVDFAPLWAERDILGAALIAHTQDAHLSTLDPRATTRRQYAALLAAFQTLLNSNPEREQALQAFLQNNPMLLCPTQVRMWPKLPLGAKVTDFVFRDATHDYVLVEIERSNLLLFRQDGHPTSDLTRAHGQIIDWKRYLEDNLQTVQRELGLTDITPNPSGLLVIGRSESLLPNDRRKLRTMTNESPKLRIMTYDDVYENAKAVFENLLGPMWDTGGDTQIYYPRVP